MYTGSIPVSASISNAPLARVAELVDAADLKSAGRLGRAGSIPAPGTKKISCKLVIIYKPKKIIGVLFVVVDNNKS